jgi:hypothetical protein
VTLFAASAAHAQQAVQWRVEDGGNGHWYQSIRPSPIPTTFAEQDAFSASRGAVMATMSTSQENDFVVSIMGTAASEHNGAMFGLRREPNGSWAWCDQTPLDFTAWGGWNCGSGPYPNNSTMTGEMCGHLYLQNCGWIWDDTPPSWSPVYTNLRLLIEWSADCNNDGIIDYGQCHDGTLPDYNGNNIPDCCEQGTPCAPGSYPVQWRVEDGGNGHWYDQRIWTGPKAIVDISASYAAQVGAHAVTITSPSENEFVYRAVHSRTSGATHDGYSILGGYQDSGASDYVEPAGGWRWVTGEPMTFLNWGPGFPDNCCYGESVLQYPSASYWNDAETAGVPAGHRYRVIIEWEADCNSDGVVDYGQILQGQLVDANTNGIPDICQEPTCHDVDLYTNGRIDGADLAALLSEWGPTTPITRSDFNHDGVVNGSDLSKILGFWGPCQ